MPEGQDFFSELQTETQPLAPWQAEVYKLVSWWDVETFAAHRFYQIGMLLELLARNVGKIASEEELAKLRFDLRKITAHCMVLGLRVSAELIGEKSALLKSLHSANKMGGDLKAISDCIRIEMGQTLFLYVPYERARWYKEPLEGWEEVIGRFSADHDITYEIEEASKCFACDRYDAAVFHIMRVAEIGALAVGTLIQIKDPKPGWPRVSKELKRIMEIEYTKLSPIEQQHFPLLEQISPLMLAMQNAWRHKVSHVANRLILTGSGFQPFVAKEIITTTRAFMRRLALELPPP